MKTLVNESTQHIIFLQIRKEIEQHGTLELSDEESNDPEVRHYFNQRLVSFKSAEAKVETKVETKPEPAKVEPPKPEPVKEKTPTQPTTPVPEVKKEETKPVPDAAKKK
jgi:outer membrane biosynthesis protein TonB